MSSDKETTDYIELRPGDRVQVWDQWLDQFGQWQFYTHSGSAGGFVNSGVKARRPIAATQPTTYEEVPGSRTTQETIVNPQRERIAHEDLQPGDIIQEGDEWQNECGRWRPFLVLAGSRVQVRQSQRVRRPYNITQLQDERDKWQRQFAAERSAREAAIVERNEAERLLAEAQMQRDKAWSDQKVIQAYRDTALQKLGNAERVLSQEHAAHVQIRNERDEFQTALIESRLALKRKVAEVMEVCKERDEACAKRDRLQGLIDDLLDEPTARQVQEMLRTWATELDWSAGCFDSVGREQIDTIQKTLVAVIERIEGMLNPEGGTDGE